MKKEEFMKNGHPYEIRDISNEDELKVQIFDKKTDKPISHIYSIGSDTAENIKSTNGHIYINGEDSIEELFKIAKKDFLDKDSQGKDSGAWAVLFQNAKSLAELGHRDEAEEAFKKAIEINPTAWAVWFQRAKNCAALGRHDKANEYYNKAEKIRKDNQKNLTKEGIAFEKLSREIESEGDKGKTLVEKDGDASVFISYIHENEDKVNLLCEELRRSGVKVWLDKDEIRPGEAWKDVIRDAIQKGSYFIACFSKEFNERGKSYMHEEITLAIEELRIRPKNQEWFIPVLLSGEVPNRSISGVRTLRDIQWVDLSRDQDWDKGIAKIVSVVSPTTG